MYVEREEPVLWKRLAILRDRWADGKLPQRSHDRQTEFQGQDEVGLTQEEGEEGKSQPEEPCLSQEVTRTAPCFFPDPLASAFFSVLSLFQAGLAMSASGPLGLAAYLDSLL